MTQRNLSLNDIWKIYLLLRPAIVDREMKDTLLGELEILAELAPEGSLVASLDIMYNNLPKNLSVAKAVELLAKGFDKYRFFDFVRFVKELE